MELNPTVKKGLHVAVLTGAVLQVGGTLYNGYKTVSDGKLTPMIGLAHALTLLVGLAAAKYSYDKLSAESESAPATEPAK